MLQAAHNVVPTEHGQQLKEARAGGSAGYSQAERVDHGAALDAERRGNPVCRLLSRLDRKLVTELAKLHGGSVQPGHSVRAYEPLALALLVRLGRVAKEELHQLRRFGEQLHALDDQRLDTIYI